MAGLIIKWGAWLYFQYTEIPLLFYKIIRYCDVSMFIVLKTAIITIGSILQVQKHTHQHLFQEELNWCTNLNLLFQCCPTATEQ